MNLAKSTLSSFAITVGTLALLATAAAAGETQIPHTMTVTGEGDVKAAPDEAQISTGVVTQAKTAAAAMAKNREAMNRVFATLENLGIAQKDIQTTDFSVSPQYASSADSQRITGYQVSNTVQATIENLSRLGGALDALVASGSNSLGDIAFSIRDPKPLESQARGAAMRDAIDKAQSYAKAGGLQLGPIVWVSEESEPPRPIFRAMAMAPAASAPTPIAAGQESISATVTVSFEIH
jgi:uncharacterized protein